MPGTPDGGLQASKTNREKYGQDFYKRIGAKGGSVKNDNKGFGYRTSCKCDVIKGFHYKQQCAGKKGGMISRRRRLDADKESM